MDNYLVDLKLKKYSIISILKIIGKLFKHA